MRKLLLFVLIFTMSSVLFAQDNSCKNQNINDSEKRSFTEPNTFSFDIDGTERLMKSPKEHIK